jgi:hypothetical protein
VKFVGFRVQLNRTGFGVRGDLFGTVVISYVVEGFRPRLKVRWASKVVTKTSKYLK